MTWPEDPTTRSKSRRRLRTAAFILSLSCLTFPSCKTLRDTLDFDTDDTAGMEPHPRRMEMPSLVGPDSGRVQPGKFPVVQFAGDDWKLAPGESAKIRSVARWLMGNPERVLLAAGARAESPEYARQLSDLRAQNVKRALVDAGVPEERIFTVSFGEDAPPSTGTGVSFSIIRTGEAR